MNYFFALIVPLIFLSSFLFAAFRKVKIYDSFCEGVKKAPPLILSIFPYIAAVMMLTKLFEVSGLQAEFEKLVSPAFRFVGVPEELSQLILMKPLSGSGAIASLSDVLEKYGVDSYIGRCACVTYGASDTIFYIGAVYFAGLKRKKLSFAILIALLSYLLSVVLCCALCKIL